MSGRPTIFSGARAIIKINEQLTVYALSVQWNVTTEYKPIQGIDNPLPEELAPSNIAVDVSCSTLRVPKYSASVLGIQPTITNFMTQGYCSITIQDRATGETILYVPRAMMVRRSGAVSTRQLSGETWIFRGIGYWDEQAPA